jgi:hypothetical protein
MRDCVEWWVEEKRLGIIQCKKQVQPIISLILGGAKSRTMRIESALGGAHR